MFYQVVAIIGAVMVLGAYFAYQRGWMGKEDRLYSVLNAVGAALLTWVAVVDQRWGFVLLEGTWSLLSIPPILRPPRPEEEHPDRWPDDDEAPSGGGA
jgi:drug/metabolite transporter (DMT)-like permease